jgi:hypothetical protein
VKTRLMPAGVRSKVAVRFDAPLRQKSYALPLLPCDLSVFPPYVSKGGLRGQSGQPRCTRREHAVLVLTRKHVRQLPHVTTSLCLLSESLSDSPTKRRGDWRTIHEPRSLVGTMLLRRRRTVVAESAWGRGEA